MIDKNIIQQLDQIFDDFTKPNTPGCIVSIIKDGQILHKRVFGMANIELNIPINENTVFGIGSISKQFTAACIALLEEEGSINIEDSIKKYIPELPEYCSKITLGNLVYMTNGIRDFYDVTQYLMGVIEDDFVNEEEALKLLCSIKDPVFQVGEEWIYGNSGYFLLSVIIKRVTGKTLAEFAKENIFNCLGMKNTFFRDDRSKIIKNRAQGYCKYEYLHHEQGRNSNNNDIYCINADNYEITGPGQVWTTIGDLYIWDQNFYNNKLGKGKQTFIDKITKSGKLNNGKNCGYGYGLFIGERNGRRHVYHGGSTAGFLSTYYRIPSENFSVIWFSNSNYSYYELAERLGVSIDKYISDLVLEGKSTTQHREKNSITEEEAEVQLNSDLNQLKMFSGSYQCSETSSIWEVGHEGMGLIVNENRENKFKLKHMANTSFKASDGSMECMFLNYNDVYEICVKRDDNEYKFEPFQETSNIEELSLYTGEYYCSQLDTTFIITIDKEMLFMKNKDRHRNGIDFHYTPSIRDHFINFNKYTGSMMITFKRGNNKIKSFVFRDYNGDKREYLEFFKII